VSEEGKDDPIFALLREELEDVHGTVSRFARENDSLRRSDRKNYERARRLENAIRLHATKRCKCANQRECLFNLGKLVTKVPRPPYKRRVKVKTK